MAWTAPRTWVTGEVVTASIMNAHVRDNLKALAADYVETMSAPWTTLTPVANQVYLVRCRIVGSKTVTSINWECETSSGNANHAIYNSSLVRQWRRSTTSYAMPAAGSIVTLISAGLPTTLTLETGDYFLAWACDNAVARMGAVSGVGLSYPTTGVMKTKAGDLAMSDPSTATDATTSGTPFMVLA